MVIPTTQKVALNSKGNYYFGSSHNNSSHFRKSTWLTSSMAEEDRTEVTFIPPIISCDKKPPREAMTTDKTNTAVDSKPFDPI
jgi:hypothetical protein